MAFEMAKFPGILERVKTPLTLAGLALLIFYGIFSKVLDLKIWAPLHEGNTTTLVHTILFYTFVLALACIILGLASFVVARLVKPTKAG